MSLIVQILVRMLSIAVGWVCAKLSIDAKADSIDSAATWIGIGLAGLVAWALEKYVPALWAKLKQLFGGEK